MIGTMLPENAFVTQEKTLTNSRYSSIHYWYWNDASPILIPFIERKKTISIDKHQFGHKKHSRCQL